MLMQRIVILMVLVVLYGCAGPSSEVGTLLRAHDIGFDDLECRHIGRTRDVACTLVLSDEAFDHTVSALQLRPVPPSNAAATSDPDGLGRLAQARAGDCVYATLPSGEGGGAFGTLGRPETLRLEEQVGFEHALLYRERSEARACLLLSYAYG
ncbi:MAG: hypothetical protein Rubg2KO_18010 [Rubricoccaceae bacterium]